MSFLSLIHLRHLSPEGPANMARKPDTPCSRCGTLLWSATTSRPAGERVCRRCRSERPAPYGHRPHRPDAVDELAARPPARVVPRDARP